MLTAAALALLFQASCMQLNLDSLAQRELNNGDGYTWLALVGAWAESSQWSPVVEDHNAPYGLETHLTAPFASVVLGLAVPLRLRMPPEEAVRTAGMLSGPLLHMATAAALAWGAGAVLGRGGVLLAVLAFLMMPTAYSRFGLHEFDHHALHLFLTALAAALVLRHTCGDGNSGRLAGAAGFVAGLGIWSGTEMLTPAGIGGLAMVLAWAIWGAERRARGLWLYALGMVIALVLALVIERPTAEWRQMVSDRLSATHVLMGAVLATAAGALALAQRRRPDAGHATRLAAAAAAGGGALLILWAAVPDFFLGPYGRIDPVVQEQLHGGGDAGRYFAASPIALGFYLFPFGFAAAGTAWHLRRDPRREAWMIIALGMAVGAALAFWQWRLLQHYTVFAAIALGGTAADLARFCFTKALAGLRAATAGLALLCAMLSPWLGAFAGIRIDDESSTRYFDSIWSHHGCDWPSAGTALARLARGGAGTIATYSDPGPELAHFSGLGVLATGCHCNAQGMSDARAILLSSSESAREVAQRRQVAFVVQCPAMRGWQGHDWYTERAGPDDLYSRLARGEPPRWLIPVPPSELGVDGIIVHRTAFDKPARAGP